MDWIQIIGLILLIVFFVIIILLTCQRKPKENYLKYKLYEDINCCCNCDYDCENCSHKIMTNQQNIYDDDDDDGYTRYNYDRFKRRYNYLGSTGINNNNISNISSNNSSSSSGIIDNGGNSGGVGAGGGDGGGGEIIG